MTQSNQERRKYYRLGNKYIVRCEAYTIPRPPASEKIECRSKNLSAGGILFESKTQYAIGDVLRLEVEVPGWERCKAEFYKPNNLSVSEPLVVIGSVVRVEKMPGGGYDIGVNFSGLDEGHRLAITKYINAQTKK